MSLKSGILGSLSIKPMSGYELKKLFNMSASYFWPSDQAQIYRTLKSLIEGGHVVLNACQKGVSVDKKIYEITEAGRTANLKPIADNSVGEFISRDAFLLKLFFSGALSCQARLELIDQQLENITALTQRQMDNFKENYRKFMEISGFDEKDRRVFSAAYSHRCSRCQGQGIRGVAFRDQSRAFGGRKVKPGLHQKRIGS